MYNIDLYNYWKEPYARDKKFSIHPLNEPGKEKYYSDQSHCKHYLKRTDPFVFKSILGYDYDTLVRLQKSDINQLKPLNNTLNQNHLEENKIGDNNQYQTGNQINQSEGNMFNNYENFKIIKNSFELKNNDRRRFKVGNNEEKNKASSSLFQSYNDKMGHTLNCIKSSSGLRKAMNEDEMRNNLFNQTSGSFLKKYHLPDILKIADSKQVIRRQRIGLSKEMGEKYNPYSLIVPSKNRTGRNYIGDLFKH